MKKTKRLLTTIVIIAMIFSVFPIQYAAAEDGEETSGNKLNYIYVESQVLETPGIQNIVVSWGSDLENISKMKLTYRNENGKEFQMESMKKAESAFLFEKTFQEEDTGIYEITEITILENGSEKKYTLEELNAEAFFGVNKEYDSEGSPELVQDDGKIVDGEEVNDLESIENSIIEADPESINSTATNMEEVIDQVQMAKQRSSKAGNLVVALDPGHGGSDPGASGNGLVERELNLKIAQYCKTEIEKYTGVTVVMTRTSNSTYLDLATRAQIGANNGADLLVSLHINSGGGQGFEVWVPNSYGGTAIGTTGKNVATKISTELAALGLNNRGIKTKNYSSTDARDYYGIIRESKARGIPAIIVEHGFIDNSTDSQFLKSESNLQKLGNADATGIAKYYGLTKKTSGTWITDTVGKKYKYTNGTFATGYVNIDGKYYYFNTSGYMQGGYQMINGKPYQFYSKEGYGYGAGWVTYSTGQKVYCLGGGKLATGYTNIGGKYYYFNTSGYMQSGYQMINGTPYQFFSKEGHGYGAGWINYSTGEKAYCLGGGKLATGSMTISGEEYTFTAGGFLVKEKVGWITDSTGKKYKYTDGTFAIGYTNIGGKYYYFNASGYMQSGYQMINGKPYQFYSKEGYGYGTGWISYNTGKKVYSLGGGKLATGYTNIGGKYYYFDASGYMQGGYQMINGTPYQFYSKEGNGYGAGWINYNTGKKVYSLGGGKLATGYTNIGGKYYYFDASGYMQGGYQMINGKPYQFYSNEGYGYGAGWINYSTGKKAYSLGGGQLATGNVTMGGKNYIFDANGFLNEIVEKYKITGNSSVTATELANLYRKSSPIGFPAYYSSNDSEAKTLEAFCQIYIDEAKAEGIDAKVAFCQAMVETGWLKFGGDVKIGQYNFAGIGATGNGATGNSFSSVRIGVRAQVQHLKAYANKEALVNACVDPRFNYVTRGCAPYVEDLGGKWAADQSYGSKILNLIKAI